MARDKSAGRTVVLHDFFVRGLDELERRVHRELGSEQPGGLVILDRLDALRAPLTSDWLARLISQKWTEDVHLLILTSKPIDGADQVFREVRRRSRRTFQMVDFFRSIETLESQALSVTGDQYRGRGGVALASSVLIS
jgi:hypothetical protein